MKNFMVGIVLLLVSTNSMAGSVTSKVTRVGAATDQYGVLFIETPAPTKPSCANEHTILSFDKSTSHGKDMYSMALTALAAQKKLVISYSDTVCGLRGNRAIVLRMDIMRN